MTASSLAPRKDRLASFTLIELLFVMAIISILVGLVLFAASGLGIKAKRSRASSEMAAMAAALEGYKSDNGIFPLSDGVLLTNSPYSAYDGTMSNYQTNSTILYIALSGQTSFTNVPASGVKSYMSFKINQVGNASAAYSYIKDPWGYSYGYSTGTTNGASTTNYPYSGGGLYDLWSTGGLIGGAQTNTAVWIANWL